MAKRKPKPKPRIHRSKKSHKGSNPLTQLSNLMRQYPLWFSIVLNLVLVLLIQSIFTVRFDTSDDVAMLFKAAGVSWYDAPYPHLYFSNVLIGYILNALYSFAPNLPWYGYYLTGALLLGHIVISNILFKRNPGWQSLTLYLFFFVLISSRLFLNLQFTISSWVLSMSGLAYLAVYFRERGDISLPEIIKDQKTWIGIGIILLGGLVRWPSLLSSFALLTPLFVPMAWRNKIAVPAVLATGLILGFGAETMSKGVYNMDKERAHHREVAPVLNQFIDYNALGNLPPEEREHALAKGGWSVNDFGMLMKWFYMDDSVYSVERAQAILNQIPPVKTQQDPVTVVRQLRKFTTSNFALNALILMGIAWLLVANPKRIGFQMLGVAGLAILLTFYLFYFKKPPPPRVYFSFYFAILLIPLISAWSMQWKHKALQQLRLAGIGVLVILAVIQLGSTWNGYKEEAEKMKEYNTWLKQEIAKIAPQPNQLYMVWTASFPWEFILPFDNLRYLRNFQTMNTQIGVTARQKMEQFNIDDPYLAIVDRGDVFLILRNSDEQQQAGLLHNYMLEHYGFGLGRTIIYQNQAFSINQFSRLPGSPQTQ